VVWKEFAKFNWNQGGIDEYREWDGLTSKAVVADKGILAKGETKFKVGVKHLASKYFTFVPQEKLTSLDFTNNSVGTEGAGVQAIIKYKDGTDKVEDWSDKERVNLCLEDPEVESVTLVFTNSNSDKDNKITYDVAWDGSSELCCTSQPTSPSKATDQSDATAGCPGVTGTITYSRYEEWQGPPGGCCTGSETLSVQIDVSMKAYEDFPGWEDDGTTYTATFESHQSGHGNYGIAECDYSDSYTGSGGGPVDAAAGRMAEEGDISAVTGQPVVGRELLVAVGRMFYDYSGVEYYTSCENPSHDATIDHGPYENREIGTGSELADRSCEGVAYLWFKTPSPTGQTLTLSCTNTTDEGVVHTLVGTLNVAG
jgi:hypothetical protein